jgi:hypothetical protein
MYKVFCPPLEFWLATRETPPIGHRTNLLLTGEGARAPAERKNLKYLHPYTSFLSSYMERRNKPTSNATIN